jgi:hypothetical protein
MLADQIVQSWVEEDREAPGIAKGDEMAFAREEFDVEHLEERNLLARHAALVDALSEGRM